MADESIIKRIHALMSKTLEAGCTEQEALAASQKVQELLHKHQLSMSDIRLRDEKCVQDGYDLGMKSDQPIQYVLSAIAYFTDTKVWRSTLRDGTISYRFFGLEHDVLIAKYITKICDKAIIFGGEDFRRSEQFQNAYAGERPKLRQSFQVGMASRLSTRIRKMKDEQRSEDKVSSGRDLVVVKNAIVEDEWAKTGIDLKSRKASRGPSLNSKAYGAGVTAADKVALNPGVTAKATQFIGG